MVTACHRNAKAKCVCVCVFSDLWEPKTYDLILMICLFSICYVMLCVITRTLQGFGRKHIISSKEAIAKTVWISDVDQGMTFCALHAVFDPKMPEADKTKRVIRLKMIPPYFPASQDGPPQDGKRILLFPYVECLYQTLGIKHLRPLHEELHQRWWYISNAEWFKAVGMAYFLNGNGS